MEKVNSSELLKKANGWVWEAQWAAREWRADAWRACEMYDGDVPLTEDQYMDMVDAGIEVVPVNRTFPAINMLVGSQIVNRFEISAKGRTQDDGEISQVMTEGVKFVMDQTGGDFVISNAYKDSLIPGFGVVSTCFDSDPRREKVSLLDMDWKSVWWDPFSTPWWHPKRTRYVFRQPWIDLDDLVGIFPERKKEIENAYQEMSGETRENGYSSLMDEAEQVEEHIRTLSSADWVDERRKRVRPVDMWYPVLEKCVFALYADGRCYEIREDMDPLEAFQIIQGSQQVVPAIVKKMRNMIFFGENLMLQDSPSPYVHDMFPWVPFIGYIDRFKAPYGVPRQIRPQAEEVIKRRSMSLALLKNRRVVAERSVVPNGDKKALEDLYDEANKIDGFMVVEDGKIDKFKVEEMAALAAPQIDLLRQSELEIREIAGPNASMMGYEGSAESGVAKQTDIMRGEITTASLKDNLRRSMNMIGDQLVANIQSSWKYEKVLRVTDRLTGAERFVTVNQPVPGAPEVKNNITQGKFDIVVSETPATDTIREKNMDLLYAAIEKSPPEAVPILLISAFEMSDLPNKELLVEKLKPILGVNPEDEGLDPKEAKERALQELQAHRQKQQMVEQLEMEALKQELTEKIKKNIELEAKIEQIKAKTQNVHANTKKSLADTEQTIVETEIEADAHNIDKDERELAAFEKGMDIGDRLKGKRVKEAEAA